MSSPPNADQTSQNSSGTFYIVSFAIFMLLGLAVLAFIGRPPIPEAVGEPLPDIDLVGLVHTDSSPSREDLDGKITLLHFWGTWCPPCRAEFPEFAEATRRFENDARVQVLPVSCSQGVEYDLEALATKTAEFLASHDFQRPVYCDPAAMTRGKLALLMPNGSFGYPTTVLVDAKGEIAEVVAGYRPGDMQRLAGRIEQLLKELPATASAASAATAESPAT